MMTKRSKAKAAAKQLNEFSEFLSSNTELLEEARIIPESFSRNRIITLQNLLKFLIFRKGRIAGENLVHCFQDSRTIPSRQAVTKRESILNYQVWKPILDKQNELFWVNNSEKKTCKGWLVLACDGTTCQLPEHLALNHVFGGTLNQTCRTPEEIKTPMCKVSTLYDTLNHHYLDFEIASYNTSEIPLLWKHLDRLLPLLKGEKVIILCDRYYGSTEFFLCGDEHGFKYVVRAKSNFFKADRAEIPLENEDSALTVELSRAWLRRFKR